MNALIANIGTVMRNMRAPAQWWADRRGGVAVFVAVAFPAFLAMGLLAVDAVRAYSQASLLSFATQSAALAGAAELRNYYTLGATNGTSFVQGKALTIGGANAASSADLSHMQVCTTQNPTYPCMTLSLGNWNTSTASFNSLSSTGTSSPDSVLAVQNLAVSTFFGGAFGTPTLYITKTATASSYPSSQALNIIVLNDQGGPNTTQSLGIPGSAQANWWSQQQAADVAILKCLQTSGNTSSQFGVTGFTNLATTLYQLTYVNVGTNATKISNAINNIGSTKFQYCRQSKTALNCDGTNVAAALYSAINQFSGAAYQNTNNHIIIITNELPLYDTAIGNPNPAYVYKIADGTGVTVGPGVGSDGVTLAGSGASSTPLCGTSPVCNNTYLKQMAEGQSAAAGTAVSGGRSAITVSTLYFSGDTSTPTGQASAYASEIASWAQNNGVSLTTSNLSDTTSGGATLPGVATQASNICKLISGGATLRTASQ